MILDSITSPADLRKLNIEQLQLLSQEIRERMVRVVSQRGGHLASSLGAVELITALHYCLNTPQDKIIFDVGHQSYAHKIITDRNKFFDNLRQYQGLSGFPSKDESEYDLFTVGHSSTAVSLALGLACSRDLGQGEYFKVVAVIGDGSLSGGLCFEGLNNAGHQKKDILVVLNTNELSIAPNAGALSVYLNKIISLPIYNRFRNSLEGFVHSRIPKGSRLIKIANKFEESLKGLFIPGIFFEELGFRYFGPLDGHDLNLLIHTLKNVRDIKGPVLFHVITKKGKGYLPAEKEPVKFHSAGPFNINDGGPLAQDKTTKTYTQVFSQKVLDLANKDNKIIAITAAMPEGTGLDKFRDAFPNRFFDVGIAEEHAICFAAGLARQGLRPVVAIYSTFLQRAYDQIIEDLALQKLGVILAIDRAGIVGEDGPTHQGVFDIAFLRHIPNMIIMAASNGLELEEMLEFALTLNKPVAIRYPKSQAPSFKSQALNSKIQLGKSEIIKEGRDFVIIALGAMLKPALEAVELLEKDGLCPTLVNARFVKPLDLDLFDSFDKNKLIITIEDGIIDGGFGSAVSEATGRDVIRLGLPCEFISQGRRDILLAKYNLNAEGMAAGIKAALQRKNGQG